SEETIKARKAKRACIRCGQTGHGQYTCPSSRPVVSAVKTEPQKRKRSVKEEDKPEQPLAKKISALVTSRGRIYELTEEDEEMADEIGNPLITILLGRREILRISVWKCWLVGSKDWKQLGD